MVEGSGRGVPSDVCQVMTGTGWPWAAQFRRPPGKSYDIFDSRVRILYSFPATMSEAKQAHCVRCREQTQYVGRQETMAVARGHLHCIPQDLFLVRADPDYKREGPWYDWVMVLFEGGGESFAELDKRCLQYQPDVVPAKVLALANHPETGVMALVHPCEFRTKEKDQKDDSVLTQIHHLHYSEVRKPYTQSVQVECDSGEQHLQITEKVHGHKANN